MGFEPIVAEAFPFLRGQVKSYFFQKSRNLGLEFNHRIVRVAERLGVC